MWLIILAICILVTILKMFSRTQFFTKTGGCKFFFSQPVAGLTNRGHVRDFRAGAPLKKLLFSILKNSDIEKVVMRKTIEAHRDTSRLGRDKQSTNKSFGASICSPSFKRRDVMWLVIIPTI